MNKKQVSFYIHIPFCKSKCYYCDFNSYFESNENIIVEYFEALYNELKIYKEKLKKYKVKSIFIGGGTPSFVDSKFISKIMDLCSYNYNLDNNAEITIETNPCTLDFDKILSYKNFGINRISIGLQAWQDRLLKLIGRTHTNKEFLDCYNNILKAGITNINADLIFGFPTQNLNEWIETIDNIVKLNIKHVSCYGLKIEENTIIEKNINEGKYKIPDDLLEREMYWYAVNKLTENDFFHYEISNFSKKGFESKHNLIYWNCEEYIGFGLGAHSYFDCKRYNNKEKISEYIKFYRNKLSNYRENEIYIDENEKIKEFIILKLRLINGFDINEFNLKFKISFMDKYNNIVNELQNKGLICVNGDNIRLTSKGLDYANIVFVEFI